VDTFIVIALLTVGFWACWHWFLRQWLETTGLLGVVKARIAAHQIPDEAYYEQASKEIHNGNVREGLWAQAWAEAEGDKTKAQAIYIRLRAQSIKREVASDNGGQYQAAGAKTIVPCPRCGTKLRMPVGKLLDVHCSKCDHDFRVDTAQENHLEDFPERADQIIGRIGRLQFLWLTLATMFAGIVVSVLINEGGLAEPLFVPPNFTTLVIAASICFNLAIIIARLHDADKSGWWSLIALIPFVYLLVVFYLLVVPGKPYRNRFGKVDAGVLV